MKNPTGNKLEKLVFRIFDQMVEGADKYVTKQGSTWLIFTESKKWVIEFTKDKTLWFNYNLFQNELDLIGKDCTEERDLIKNWFESRFLNKPKVKEVHHVDVMKFFDKKMENTIENGVKDTIEDCGPMVVAVEDTIQNGVKETQTRMWPPVGAVDETIENGVKLVDSSTQIDGSCVIEDVIKEGVKEAKEDRLFRTIHVMNAIVNGVKHVEDGDWLDQDERIDDIIESGVKEVNTDYKNPNSYHHKWTIDYILENGVKETKESMLESLEQIDHQVTNCEITENINDAIENGVKETKEISNISLMSEMFKVKAKQAIRDGVKELKLWKSNRCEEHGYFEFVDGIPTYTPMIQVKDVLENGVKEIQPLPAQDGNRDWGLYYHRQEDRTKPHTEYVKEVIEDSYNHRGRVEGVIRNTDKDGF